MVLRPRAPTRMGSPDIMSRVPKSPANRNQYAGNDAHHQAGQQQRTNSVPILVALIENRQFEQAIYRVRQHPKEASTVIFNREESQNSSEGQGNLVLHEACKNEPTLGLIEALLEANEGAAHTKGQWGYLPLHFACCSRASPEVIARLIMTYPSATRTKEDQEGRLPLHVAANWGADEDVIMALLTVHPKASVIRDASGRTPVEYASSLSSPHAREGVSKALRRAPLLVAVSKAAMNKLAYESDSKLREVVEVYQDRMAQVKDKYEEDKTHAVALEVQLRKEVWEEKERTSKLSDQVSELSNALAQSERLLMEKEQILQQIQQLMMGMSPIRGQSSVSSLAEDNLAHSRPEPESRTQAPVEQEENERDDARVKRKEQKRLAKIAVQEWIGVDTDENREPVEEEREGPPSGQDSPYEENGYAESDQPEPERREPAHRENKRREMSRNASPRSAAVATVKEWFSSETDEMEKNEQPNSGYQYHQSETSGYQHQSLLDRSKQSGLRTSEIITRVGERRCRSSGRQTRNSQPEEGRSRSSGRQAQKSPGRRALEVNTNANTNTYSNSTRKTQRTESTAASSRSGPSHASSGRRQYTSVKQGREEYRESGRNASTKPTMYDPRAIDDEYDEDPTINSRLEWE